MGSKSRGSLPALSISSCPARITLSRRGTVPRTVRCDRKPFHGGDHTGHFFGPAPFSANLPLEEVLVVWDFDGKIRNHKWV